MMIPYEYPEESLLFPPPPPVSVEKEGRTTRREKNIDCAICVFSTLSPRLFISQHIHSHPFGDGLFKTPCV
uniref:C2H2-type domain-containing protein n=1 Tax=Caenorhabditis tropicalis TaxID=1561998 RepID=A0A1I7TT83_9PELO